jgi:hypothetical protein
VVDGHFYVWYLLPFLGTSLVAASASLLVFPPSWIRLRIVIVIIVVVVALTLSIFTLPLIIYFFLNLVGEDGEVMDVERPDDDRAAELRVRRLKTILDDAMGGKQWRSKDVAILGGRRKLEDVWFDIYHQQEHSKRLRSHSPLPPDCEPFWQGDYRPPSCPGSYDYHFLANITTPVWSSEGSPLCIVRRFKAPEDAFNIVPDVVFRAIVFVRDPRMHMYGSWSRERRQPEVDEVLRSELSLLTGREMYGQDFTQLQAAAEWLVVDETRDDDDGLLVSRQFISHGGRPEFQSTFLFVFVESLAALLRSVSRLADFINLVNEKTKDPGMAHAMIADFCTQSYVDSFRLRLNAVKATWHDLRGDGRIQYPDPHEELSNFEILCAQTVRRVATAASVCLTTVFTAVADRHDALVQSWNDQTPVVAVMGPAVIATAKEVWYHKVLMASVYASDLVTSSTEDHLHVAKEPAVSWLCSSIGVVRIWPSVSSRSMTEAVAHACLLSLHAAMDHHVAPPNVIELVTQFFAPVSTIPEVAMITDAPTPASHATVDDTISEPSASATASPTASAVHAAAMTINDPVSSSSSSSSSRTLSLASIVKCAVLVFLAMLSFGTCQPARPSSKLRPTAMAYSPPSLSGLIQPPCPLFADIAAVQRSIDTLFSCPGGFTWQRVLLQQNRRLAALSHEFDAPKPHAMNVGEMFHPYFCGYGASVLPIGDNTLVIDAFDQLHCSHCANCHPLSIIHPQCYFNQLRLCLTNGFRPPVRQGWVIPPYHARGEDGNHLSASQFRIHTHKAVSKLFSGGIVRPYPFTVIRNPIGIAIPNAKKQLAYSLTGINIIDDASFEAADERIQALALEPFKRRLIVDATASGINSMFDVMSFSYITIQDMLQLVQRDDYLAVTDIAAYFHTWPLALESRPLFGIQYAGVQGVFARLPFGGAPCPYLASTMTAEVCAGLRALGIDVCAMVDDFALRASTHDGAVVALQLLIRTVEGLGMSIAADKTQLGQVVRFIGFLIDTKRMVVSFDPASTQGFLRVLEQAMVSLAHGYNLDRALIVHIAGKLNHYAAVFQAGKLHVSTLWGYLHSRHHFSATGRATLLDDLDWWASRIRKWASGDPHGSEFPILNADTLSTPDALLFSATDYSGPHGIGGYYGGLHDTNPTVFSEQWPGGPGTGPASSLAGELCGLRALVQHLLALPNPPRAKVLVWVTDNMGAAQSVNAGRCFDFDGLVILRVIFDILETLGIVVVALWHDRIANTFADFLSHLAFSLRTPVVCTTLQGISALRAQREGDGEVEVAAYSESSLRSVPVLVGGTGGVISTSLPPGRQSVHMPARSATGGEHALDRRYEVKPEDMLRTSGHLVAHPGGMHVASGSHPSTEVRRFIRHAESACPTHDAPQCNHRADAGSGGYEFTPITGPHRSLTVKDNAARSDARGGVHLGDPRLRRNVVEEGQADQVAPPSHEDLTHWSRSFRHARRQPRPLLRRATASQAVGHAPTGRPPRRIPVSEGHTGSRHRRNVCLHCRGSSCSGQAECRPRRPSAPGVLVSLA